MSELGNITEFASHAEKTGIAERFYLQSLARELLPNHRVNICWRHRLPAAETIDVVHLVQSGRGHIRGLMKCASLWVCAVCAARITEQRRAELQQAIENSRAEFVPVMVTYTMSHNQGDSLKTTLQTMLTSYRAMRSGRWWQDFKTANFLAGSVRATEITYGENGWHPHFHEILFLHNSPGMREAMGEMKAIHLRSDEVSNALDFEFLTAYLEQAIANRWAEIITHQGKFASVDHGVKVTAQQGDLAAYVAKYGRLPRDTGRWTIAHELTKAITKRTAGNAGATPYELLNAYGAGDEKAGQLFEEYADATTGKSQLHWSRGMREQLGLLPDVKDDDITAQDDQESYILLAQLSSDQWKHVVSNGWTAALMDAASANDQQRVNEIVGLLPRTITVDLGGTWMDCN